MFKSGLETLGISFDTPWGHWSSSQTWFDQSSSYQGELSQLGCI